MFAIVKRYPVKSVIRLVMPCEVFYCYVFFSKLGFVTDSEFNSLCTQGTHWPISE